MEKEKIKYGDLSWQIKVAIIAAWIMGIIYVIAFVTGMIVGVLAPV